MGCKARVYMKRPAHEGWTYLGEMEVDASPAPRPVRNGHVRFMLNGVREDGRVDHITPDDWEKTGAIPTIHIVLSPGE